LSWINTAPGLIAYDVFNCDFGRLHLTCHERILAMTVDNAVFSFAGFMALISLALGYFHSEYWYLLNAFVGLNLLQAGITGFCPAALIFKRLGLRPGAAFK